LLVEDVNVSLCAVCSTTPHWLVIVSALLTAVPIHDIVSVGVKFDM